MSKAKEYVRPKISQGDTLSARLIELTRELDEKNRRLEQSESARKNMFSNITHDLRAPVSVIRGAAERLLNENTSPEDRRKMAGIIYARIEALDRLCNDLHFSTLVDQPEFSLSLVPLDIAPVLEEYYITAAGAGMLDERERALHIPGGFSGRAMIDPQYFLRVLDNLLSNALRHTREGDRIELGCRDAEGGVEIFLSDSGDGIHPGDIPRIFDRTFTGSAARTPGRTGSGLGLSIAEAIVKKHGGHIRCESVYGKGSVFTVCLPPA